MKFFYTNYETDDSIDEPIKAELEYVTHIFHELKDEPDNFLGLIDDEENCIQFLKETDDVWLLDIPKPPSFENLQAYVNDDQCLSLIKNIFIKNKIEVDIKLHTVRTMEETLDDVL